MTHPTPTLNIGDRVEIDNYHYPPDSGIVRSEPNATMVSRIAAHVLPRGMR